MKRLKDDSESIGKQPGFYFYPLDWMRDLRACSLRARGLWTDCLCYMHFAARRGYLEHPNGAAITVDDLARMEGCTVREIKAAMAELERFGIFSRDENGVIFNRRMVYDTDISEKRKRAASVRLLASQRDHDGRFAGDFAPAKQPANYHQNSDFAPAQSPIDGPAKPQQNTVLSSSSSISTTLSPPYPPLSTNTASKPQWSPDWDRCVREYPETGVVNPMSDLRLFLSIIETAEEETRFFNGLARWKLCQRWQEGYVVDLEKFLSKRLYLANPPKDATKRSNSVQELYQ